MSDRVREHPVSQCHIARRLHYSENAMSIPANVEHETITAPHSTYTDRLIHALTSYAKDQATREGGYTKGFALWLDGMEKHIESTLPDVDHIAAITAKEVEEMMIDIEKRRLDHIVVLLKGQYFEQAWKLGLDAARRAAEYHEAIPEGFTWDIDCRRGMVLGELPMPPADPIRVKDAVARFLAADAETLNETAEGSIPAEIDPSVPEEFLVDFAALLLELTAGERAVVGEMLSDQELAGRIATREWAPKPLKYLAGLCAA